MLAVPAQGTAEDVLDALGRQLAAQHGDGLRADGIVLQVFRELHEDGAPFGAQRCSDPQPDLGARVGAGTPEHLAGLWILGELTGQEEKILDPYPGFGVPGGVLEQALLDVHRLSQPLPDSEEHG